MLKNHLFSYIALAVLEKSPKNNFFGDDFENKVEDTFKIGAKSAWASLPWNGGRGQIKVSF